MRFECNPFAELAIGEVYSYRVETSYLMRVSTSSLYFVQNINSDQKTWFRLVWDDPNIKCRLSRGSGKIRSYPMISQEEQDFSSKINNPLRKQVVCKDVGEMLESIEYFSDSLSVASAMSIDTNENAQSFDSDQSEIRKFVPTKKPNFATVLNESWSLNERAESVIAKKYRRKCRVPRRQDTAPLKGPSFFVTQLCEVGVPHESSSEDYVPGQYLNFEEDFNNQSRLDISIYPINAKF